MPPRQKAAGRPHDDVQKLEAQLAPTGKHQIDTAPVDKGGEQAAIEKVGGRRRHPVANELRELVATHLPARHSEFAVVALRGDVTSVRHPRSLKPAVPGEKDMALVYQHRDSKTKRLNAGGDLGDLLLRMCAGVARVRPDLREHERLDKMHVAPPGKESRADEGASAPKELKVGIVDRLRRQRRKPVGSTICSRQALGTAFHSLAVGLRSF